MQKQSHILKCIDKFYQGFQHNFLFMNLLFQETYPAHCSSSVLQAFLPPSFFFQAVHVRLILRAWRRVVGYLAQYSVHPGQHSLWKVFIIKSILSTFIECLLWVRICAKHRLWFPRTCASFCFILVFGLVKQLLLCHFLLSSFSSHCWELDQKGIVII